MAAGTPGGREDSVREEHKSKCPECGEIKAGVVERSGNFAGETMCSDCLTQKQEEREKKEAKSVLEKIRNADGEE